VLESASCKGESKLHVAYRGVESNNKVTLAAYGRWIGGDDTLSGFEGCNGSSAGDGEESGEEKREEFHGGGCLCAVDC
jgi:hypothetical protein